MKIATNETLFRMTCQLWHEAYCHSGEKLEDLTSSTSVDDCIAELENCDVGDYDYVGKDKDSNNDLSYKWHPFGAFDCSRGHMVSQNLLTIAND